MEEIYLSASALEDLNTGVNPGLDEVVENIRSNTKKYIVIIDAVRYKVDIDDKGKLILVKE
jgi:hypothetical protein